MADKLAIIAICITVLLPIVIWLRKSYFIGPELVIEFKKTGSSSAPQGPSWNNVYVNGEINANEALYIYKLEWEFQITIRNNSEHTAYYVKIAFEEGKKPFSRNDAISELKPRPSRDEAVLNAFFVMNEECKSRDRTKMDTIPAHLKDFKILLEYKNSSKATFYTLYDHAQRTNKRMRIRPKGFVNEVSGLVVEKPKQRIKGKEVLNMLASIAGIIATGILIWQVFFAPTNDPTNARNANSISPIDTLKQNKKLSNKTPEKGTAKYELNAPVVNSAVGDNAIVNNYEKPDREVSEELIKEVLKQVKDKNTSISISPRSGDKESFSFVSKNVQELKKMGYKNAYENGVFSVNDGTTGISYSWDGDVFWIVVPSK